MAALPATFKRDLSKRASEALQQIACVIRFRKGRHKTSCWMMEYCEMSEQI